MVTTCVIAVHQQLRSIVHEVINPMQTTIQCIWAKATNIQIPRCDGCTEVLRVRIYPRLVLQIILTLIHYASSNKQNNPQQSIIAGSDKLYEI